MKKIKIAHLLHIVGPAGKEQGVLKIVNRMDKTKFDVDIIVMKDVRYPELLDLENFNIIRLESIQGNSLKLVPQLAEVLKREKYDVIYTHSWNTLLEGYLAAKWAGTPVKIHGEHGTFERSSLKDKLQRLLWGKFDAVTVVVGDLEAKLRNIFNYGKNNIAIVYNGTDHTKFYPSEKFRHSFRKAHQLEDVFLIGTVGRFHPVKDHFTLIKGFATFAKDLKDVKLALVGGGGATGESYKRKYEALIAELGIEDKVIFIPPTSHPEQMLNMFDVFVLSSISEGCSNVILEAMSCGIPVVATDTGGNPELVKENHNGMLFPVGDADELAKKLHHLYKDKALRENFSKIGLDIIKKQFTIEKTVNNYEQLFINLYNAKTNGSRA